MISRLVAGSYVSLASTRRLQLEVVLFSFCKSLKETGCCYADSQYMWSHDFLNRVTMDARSSMPSLGISVIKTHDKALDPVPTTYGCDRDVREQPPTATLPYG